MQHALTLIALKTINQTAACNHILLRLPFLYRMLRNSLLKFNMNVNVPAATGQDANITGKQLPTHLTEAHISPQNQEMHETFVPTVWDSLSLHFFSYPVPSFVHLNYILSHYHVLRSVSWWAVLIFECFNWIASQGCTHLSPCYLIRFEVGHEMHTLLERSIFIVRSFQGSFSLISRWG